MAQADVALSSHEVQEEWLNRALKRAGIDRNHWRPARGVDENEVTIEAVYTYYGRLFLEHPYLQWAGMANMVGPAFYAGFRDVGLLPDVARHALRTIMGRRRKSLETVLAGDLGFYETTFLRMQKKIFEDQAPLHEAYLAKGITEIERFSRARIIDTVTLEGWRQIDRGRYQNDPVLLSSGNRALLFREQWNILDHFYIRILGHCLPEGPLFTYLMTLVGAPSVPSARSYAERYPFTLAADIAGPTISLATPLADGNIAVFANRWMLIEQDTLPAYLDFVSNRPDEARALVTVPIRERMSRYRLLARIGMLAAAAITHWGVKVSLTRPSWRVLGVRPTRPVSSAGSDPITIDLTAQPTRASADFGQNDSRIWMSTDRRSLAIEVALPSGQAADFTAEVAIMLSSVRGGEPNLLMLQLGYAELDDTQRLLTKYAHGWNFPDDALADWLAEVQRRTSSNRDYGTRVFVAEPIGFVNLEFQVAHHVREDTFALAAVFSWNVPE